MKNFTIKSTIFAISLLGIDSQYSYNKGSKIFKDVSSFNIFNEYWLDTGGLSIDDCLIEKPFAKEIEGVYWQYSSKLNDYAKGLNITVLTWSNGKIIVPIRYMVIVPLLSISDEVLALTT